MGNWSRFILWDFKRASWQYDVIVILILAFIFVTPREIFRDQPKAANVVMLPAEQGTGLFWIAPQVLAGVPSTERTETAASQIKKQYNKRMTVTRVEPLMDAEMDVTGYMAYTQP